MINSDKPLRILVVDDEQNLRLLLGRQLQMSGHEICLAADGLEAIASLEQEEFSVILSDMSMPGADGLDVLRAAKHRWPRTEVIVLTAHGSLENVLAAVRAGNLFDYLTKPLADIQEASLAVNRALERRNLCAENLRLKSELDAAFDELRENAKELVETGKMVSVGQIADTVAKQINAPLQSVIELASYLNTKLGSSEAGEMEPSDQQRMLHALRRVDHAARECQNTVDALLRYTKADAGHSRAQNINDVLRDTLTLIEPAVAAQGTELGVELAEDLPMVLGPASSLQQVFTSLMLSAAASAGPGGEVTVRTERLGNRPSRACAIFGARGRRASQPDIATRRGLEIADSIVRDLHGEIEVSANPDGGELVAVTLPGLDVEELPTPQIRVA